MSADLGYFTAKLAEAVWVLATHPGPICQRLRSAVEETPGIVACSRSDLPERLRPLFDATIGLLRKPDASGTVDLQARLLSMTQEDACSVARGLHELLGECRSAVSGSPPS